MLFRSSLVADKLAGNLTRSVPNNTNATLRFQARWLAGSPNLLMLLKGAGFELSARLSIPRDLGTPGARNSRWVLPGSSPPALSNLEQTPLLPAAGEVVVISCQAELRGQTVPVLEWKLDGALSYEPAAMADDGMTPDAQAGDGIFTGVLPGQSAGKLVVFRVRASQGDLSNSLPLPGPHGESAGLVRFGEKVFGGDFGDYRIWMQATNVASWDLQPNLCNQLFPATFVWNNFRIVHGAGIRFSGSTFTRPNYSNPVDGSEAGYVIRLQIGRAHV